MKELCAAGCCWSVGPQASCAVPVAGGFPQLSARMLDLGGGLSCDSVGGFSQLSARMLDLAEGLSRDSVGGLSQLSARMLGLGGGLSHDSVGGAVRSTAGGRDTGLLS